jgi:hypothetical protein
MPLLAVSIVAAVAGSKAETAPTDTSTAYKLRNFFIKVASPSLSDFNPPCSNEVRASARN